MKTISYDVNKIKTQNIIMSKHIPIGYILIKVDRTYWIVIHEDWISEDKLTIKESWVFNVGSKDKEKALEKFLSLYE